MTDRRLPVIVLTLVTAFLLGNGLSMRVPEHKSALFSDEATYHSMAYSFAYDGDMEYRPADLRRVYELGYDAGPQGIFLQREATTGRLYFSKAFVYSLAAAPFVRILADNGFFVLHALMFGLVMACGFAWLRRTLSPSLAAFYTITYFCASVVLVYQFWIMPEWFNLSVGFVATFLWLYKERPPAWPRTAPWQPQGWLAGSWTNYAAAVLYGVAAYSKPPSLLLVAPMLVWIAAKRRWRHALGLGLATLLTIVALFGTTQRVTGNWNYMGGDRKSFSGPYPYQSAAFTFESISTGTPMITDLEDYKERIPAVEPLLADLVYVLVGRNSGLLIYMFPAVLCLLLYLAAPGRTLRSPYGLLIAAWAIQALAFMTVIQGNWIGGGGAIGARYFVSFYYVPFFLIPAGIGILGAVAAWVVAALFLAQILLNPFASSFDPSLHTKALPFKLLPPELTMLNNLPFNTHPSARRVDMGHPEFYLYFLDDETWLREEGTYGFWVKRDGDAELVLRASQPIRALLLDVHNAPVPNHVRARMDGQAVERLLDPGEKVRLRLETHRAFPYGNTFVYRFTIRSESGFIPWLDEYGSRDVRRLGIFVEVDIEPADA